MSRSRSCVQESTSAGGLPRRGRLHPFIDDQETFGTQDHSLGLEFFVAGEDDEAPLMGSHIVELAKLDRDHAFAVSIEAFAAKIDDVGGLIVGVGRLDVLCVGVTSGTFVGEDPGEAGEGGVAERRNHLG